MGLADPPPHLIAAGQTDPGQRRELNEDAWRIADESDLGDIIEERGHTATAMQLSPQITGPRAPRARLLRTGLAPVHQA